LAFCEKTIFVSVILMSYHVDVFSRNVLNKFKHQNLEKVCA